MAENKEKEDTDKIVPMPDEEKYGLPTEATPIPPSQLEIEVTETNPTPLQLEKGVNGDDDTRILNENGEIAKPVYEEPKRDKGFAKALEAIDKVHEKRSRRLSNDEPSTEYKGEHIYTWWKKNSSNGEWEIIGSRPKSLWVRLDLEDIADINAEEIVYGGNKFIKYAYFEYDYNTTSGFKGRCKKDDRIRLNKYSLTPNAEKEIVDKVKCEQMMNYLERKKQEEKRKKEEKEIKRKEESSNLTIKTPLRFPQKE
jgi:hypothetical protein